jgi:outer membrane protein OmpA-like peptidoglycan-associated protein
VKRPAYFVILAVLCSLGFATAAFAMEIELSSSLFPEKTTIDVPLVVTAIGPKMATAEASIQYKAGQAQIEISYKNMQPAVMFAGNITSYAVFAVTKGGAVENLGELHVTDAKGSSKFSTGQKTFGLIVTAEPISGSTVPSTLVIFKSGAAKKPEAKSEPIKFNRFGNAYYQNLVNPGNQSIADFPPFKEFKEPVELMKARKLVETAEGMKLAPEVSKNLADAKQTLAQATNTQTAGGSSRVVTDYAARAAALASDAIRLTIRKDYEKKLSDEEAKKAAEKAALQTNLAQTSSQLDATTKQKAEIEALLVQVRAEKAGVEAQKAAVEADAAKVKAERDELAGMLVGALGKVASTQANALGAVVNLPGISFQTNQAALVRKAELTVAQLAGVLLVFPKVNIRVEGFTDSTGNLETNMKLSTARAKTVYDLLKAQAVPESRLAFKGRGPEAPVASNDTKEGRAQNRRVEVIAIVPQN